MNSFQLTASLRGQWMGRAGDFMPWAVPEKGSRREKSDLDQFPGEIFVHDGPIPRTKVKTTAWRT
jgi:hypothetical protein